MSGKSPLSLSLVCPLAMFLIGSVSPYARSSPSVPDAPVASAPQGPDVPKPPAEPLPPPEPKQPRTHTLTIYNGAKVLQQTFIWRNGSWQTCRDCEPCDVFVRDCPSSPWHCYGTYHSRRQAEKVACTLKANGNLTSIRPHCD
jgi:hypothetical protein